MSTEAIRRLQCGECRLIQIQRTSGLLDRPDRHAVGIDHGRLQAGMAELGLNGADVVTGLQEVGGKGMAESVGRNPLGDPRHGRTQDRLQRD